MILLAFVAAFALTLMVQWTATGAWHWARGFLAWGLLMLTGTAGVTELELDHANAIGLTYVPLALFLGVVVPPRDARWTVAALAAGVATYALVAAHHVFLALAVAPVPLIAAELVLGTRSPHPARGVAGEVIGR